MFKLQVLEKEFNNTNINTYRKFYIGVILLRKLQGTHLHIIRTSDLIKGIIQLEALMFIVYFVENKFKGTVVNENLNHHPIISQIQNTTTIPFLGESFSCFCFSIALVLPKLTD